MEKQIHVRNSKLGTLGIEFSSPRSGEGQHRNEEEETPDTRIAREYHHQQQDHESVGTVEDEEIHDDHPRGVSSSASSGFRRFQRKLMSPFYSVRSYFSELTKNFTGRFVVYVALVYLLIKGLGYHATKLVALPYFTQHLAVSLRLYVRYRIVGGLGWSMKPLLATVSDLLPILGYQKRYYVFLFSLIGAAALIAAANLPPPGTLDAAAFAPDAAGLFFLIGMSVAGVDILIEGKYSSILRSTKRNRVSIVTWVWWWATLGGLAGSVMEGFISQDLTPTYVLWILAPFFVVCGAVPPLLGAIPEEKVPLCGKPSTHHCGASASTTEEEEEMHDEHSGSDAEEHHQGGGGGEKSNPQEDEPLDTNSNSHKICDVEMMELYAPLASSLEGDNHRSFRYHEKKHIPVKAWIHRWLSPPPPDDDEVGRDAKQQSSYRAAALVLGVLSSFIAIALTVMLLRPMTLRHAFLPVALGGALTIIVGTRIKLPRLLFRVALFAFLKELFYLHLFDFTDNWATAPADCVPDGPHFGMKFYHAYSSLVGGIFLAFGTILFQTFLSSRKFRTTFLVTTALKSACSVFTIFFVLRWNRSVGIDDKWMFLVGTDAIFMTASMLDYMPLVVLLSRACPPGVESTSFALLSSLLNLGITVSRSLASLLAEQLGVYARHYHHVHHGTFMGSSSSANRNPGLLGAGMPAGGEEGASSFQSGLLDITGSSGSGTDSSSNLITGTWDCNFDNLPLLLFIGHFITPLFIFIAAIKLLPDEQIDRSRSSGHDSNSNTSSSRSSTR